VSLMKLAVGLDMWARLRKAVLSPRVEIVMLRLRKVTQLTNVYRTTICASLLAPKPGDCDYGKVSVWDFILIFSGHDKMLGT
jgi:hypothetical protein